MRESEEDRRRRELVSRLVVLRRELHGVRSMLRELYASKQDDRLVCEALTALEQLELNVTWEVGAGEKQEAK